MRLLVDTHVLLWFLAGQTANLNKTALDAIAGADEAYVSTASLMEVALKTRIGKLQIKGELREFVAATHTSGFAPLSLEADHAVALSKVPRLHNDPFDHMLIAQAQVEDLTLVTCDGLILDLGYPDVKLLDARPWSSVRSI